MNPDKVYEVASKNCTRSTASFKENFCWNPTTWEEEAGESEFWAHLLLYNKAKRSLDYRKSHSKIKQSKTKEGILKAMQCGVRQIYDFFPSLSKIATVSVCPNGW